ncbi:hypothetical protein [Streptomyces sp. NPDC020983]|uniref:hypothetical protein n=1 Tax=Streptomyces sp. NPDC020983 TaxID=3365106 RepID=UPI0037B9FF20
MTRHRTHVPAAGRLRAGLAAALVTACAGALALLTGCDDSSGGGSPSGTGLPSAVRSAVSSGAAAASSAASSAAAAASGFAASAGAGAAGATASFDAALARAAGQGNAIDSVQLTSVPTARTGGLNAVVVGMANNTAETASYAVKVEFTDSTGHVVDSSVVGATGVAAGRSAQAIAFTTEDRGTVLTPRVAKAQRF